MNKQYVFAISLTALCSLTMGCSISKTHSDSDGGMRVPAQAADSPPSVQFKCLKGKDADDSMPNEISLVGRTPFLLENLSFGSEHFPLKAQSAGTGAVIFEIAAKSPLNHAEVMVSERNSKVAEIRGGQFDMKSFYTCTGLQ